MAYQHTQVGYGMAVISLGLAAIVAVIARSPDSFGVMCLLVGIAATMFSTLTTAVDAEAVRVRFGPIGLIRTRVALADITAARAMRTSPVSGWGMRYVRHGRLWNLWGLDAVELQLKNGTRFLIGTDEPQALVQALRHVGVRT